MDIEQPFWIADWLIDPPTCRIKRGDIETKLEPKVMTVLTCLAENAGQVVSRDELEATVWKDMVVGYDSLASTIIKLRKAFDDDSKNPQFIETVPKRGYRLIAMVSEMGPLPGEEAEIEVEANTGEEPEEQVIASQEQDNKPGRLKHYILPIAVIAFMAIVIAVWPTHTDRQETQDTKPTIAVLPFKNLSNDPEQEYFSDGMTGDIITDLSKISGISVIARNSVFTYKGLDIDIKELGKDLGATYVVEGSVQKFGDKVRISARLIDTQTSHSLWADRFDGTFKDVFSLQDEVTHNVVTSLAIKLTENERKILVHEYTKSIEAYDEFLKGWQLFWIFSKESNHRAREHFLKAIELDNEFARAYANLALTHTYDYMNAWKDDTDHSMQQALEFAQKGVEMDPSIPQVHWVMGLTQMFNKNYQPALESAQRTLDQDPNYADGHGLMGTILNYAGNPREALEFMKTAMQLNPFHPSIYKIIRGEIHFNLHEYDNAIRFFKEALERNPEAQEARLWLAAAYAHNNQLEDATWQMEYIQQNESKLTLDYIEKVSPFKDPAQRRHFLDGLYKAGLEAN
ncbi:winged helix-turn-helix domain-containing tetratricopeptide repeat protein [Kaarinaea lacus]